MFTCDFSQRGNLSLTQVLYDSLKKEIQEGRINAHEKLPSKRELADHLGISVITVQNAYIQLIDEGWIYSIEKKGYFAEDIGNLNGKTAESKVPQFSKPSAEVTPKKTFLADFTSNTTSSHMFPFSTWSQITRKVLAQYETSILKPQNFRGTLYLRTEICRYLKNFRDMDVKPEQVVIGAGTESLYSMVIKFFGHDKIYGMENPGYKKLALIYKSSDCNWRPVPMDESGISINQLKKSNVDIIHVTPSHHFPSGSVMSIKRRNELLEWAWENDAYILEDDYDSEFRFLGQPLKPLYSADTQGHTIYMNTFTKSLSPSFRISFMVIPENLLSKFCDELGFYSCTVGSFEQYTLAQFMAEGHFERHIRRMKNYYKNLRNSLIYALENSPLKKRISIMEEHAGLHFLMQVDSSCNGKELQSKLENLCIKIALLEDYNLDEESGNLDKESSKTNLTQNKPVFVVNYTGIEKEKISEIVKKMEQAFIS